MRAAAIILALCSLCGCASDSSTPSGDPARDKAPSLRVLLREAASDPATPIGTPGRYTLRAHPSGEKLAAGQGSGRTATQWLGRPPRACRLVADGGTLRVGDRSYNGSLLLLSRAEGTLIVLETDVESYLPGVLAGELSADFPSAALRAQAIASRTYALHRARNRPSGRTWDVTDDHMSQVFKGNTAQPAFRGAAADTRGIVLLWRGAPLPAYFHSTCGGHTAAAHESFDSPVLPPLMGSPCEFCRISRYYTWDARIPVSEAATALGMGGTIRGARIRERGVGGRAVTLEFATEATKTFPAAEARAALGYRRLFSTLIHELSVRDGHLVIRGGGWGHGVGMCQMGARGMAAGGASSADILSHYYPGAGLFRLY